MLDRFPAALGGSGLRGGKKRCWGIQMCEPCAKVEAQARIKRFRLISERGIGAAVNRERFKVSA